MLFRSRFGPYIKRNKDNFKLPKTTDPKLISLDEVRALIAEQEANAPAKVASRKPDAKKSPAKKAPAKKAPAKKSAKKSAKK